MSTAVRSDIVRLTVTNSDGRIFLEQKHRYRFADNVAAAQDDGVLSGDRQFAALQNLDHAGRGARDERRLSRLQLAHVDGMKAVHIFGRADRFEQQFGVHLRRQRQLDKDAVDVFTGSPVMATSAIISSVVTVSGGVMSSLKRPSSAQVFTLLRT